MPLGGHGVRRCGCRPPRCSLGHGLGAVGVQPVPAEDDGGFELLVGCVDQCWTGARVATLNPAEGVWSHLKHSLANLAAITVDRLEALVRTRLKRLQDRATVLDGFLAETGLTFQPQPP